MKIRTLYAHRFKIAFPVLIITTVAALFFVTGCSSEPPAKDESKSVLHNTEVPAEVKQQPRGTNGTSTTSLPPPLKYYEDQLPPRTEPFATAVLQPNLKVGQWYCRHAATTTGVASVYLVAGPFSYQDGRPGQYYVTEQRLGGSSGEQTVAQVELAWSLGAASDADGTWNPHNWLAAGRCPQKEEDTPPQPK